MANIHRYYRNYKIFIQASPFGNWSFQHNDFDGAPDSPTSGCSDHRCGYADTPRECMDEIDAQYEDLELDEDGHITCEVKK
jgi:hypothetical protein